jgi:hypothetical protein
VVKNRKNNLFIVLSGIFITNALLAELIGVKIFSLENTMGFSPANFNILGNKLDFNLTAGVIMWPVVFITTDIINEYFGKQGVKKITYFAVLLISYTFIVISLVTFLSPASFWLDINNIDDTGKPFDISYAFNKIFRQGLGIIIGSLIAFLIAQFLDVFIFQRLRKITGSKMIWLRATGSTLVSQFIDSFVVLAVAFYIFGNWPLSLVVSVGIMNYLYKFTIAIVLTPVLYLGHFIIDSYLGKEEADNMANEAMENS